MSVVKLFIPICAAGVFSCCVLLANSTSANTERIPSISGPQISHFQLKSCNHKSCVEIDSAAAAGSLLLTGYSLDQATFRIFDPRNDKSILEDISHDAYLDFERSLLYLRSLEKNTKNEYAYDLKQGELMVFPAR